MKVSQRRNIQAGLFHMFSLCLLAAEDPYIVMNRVVNYILTLCFASTAISVLTFSTACVK